MRQGRFAQIVRDIWLSDDPLFGWKRQWAASRRAVFWRLPWSPGLQRHEGAAHWLEDF